MFEKSWSLLGQIIRYLVIDILIDLVLYGLGYGFLKLLKILTGDRFPARPLSQLAESIKIGSGVLVSVLLIWLMWWLFI